MGKGGTMRILGAAPRRGYSPLDGLWLAMAQKKRYDVTLWGMDRRDGPRYRRGVPLAEVAHVFGAVDAALVSDPWHRLSERWDLKGMDCPIAMVLIDSCFRREEKVAWLREQPLTALLLRIKDDVPRYAEALPGVKVRWLPFGFNPAVFKDWGVPKDYDVAMFGHRRIGNYPVRARAREVHVEKPDANEPTFEGREVLLGQRKFRFVDFTHNDPHGRVPSGKQYAWQINRARIAVTTAGMFNLVVQKYYETPACKTALVCNAAQNGFDELFDREKHLRVFSDDCSDLVDTIECLLSRPAELKKLTDAGWAHVHAKHTNARRVEQLEHIMGWQTTT